MAAELSTPGMVLYIVNEIIKMAIDRKIWLDKGRNQKGLAECPYEEFVARSRYLSQE